jgi:hypothetical protein
MVNKVMWEVDRSDANLSSFKNDQAAFLDEWQRAALSPEPPYPSGGTLSALERKALETLDFGALYAMGANPYLLWQFARSVSVPDRMSIEDLVSSFRTAVEPHGSPDFRT